MRVSDVPEPGTGRFAILQEPKEARFAFFQSEELLKASVMRVVNPVAFDGLGHPVEGGLYDPAMGPTKLEQGPCVTCGLSSEHCPGHLGRIELCVPVYNPILFPNMYRLLGAICFNCNRFRYPKFRADFYRVKLLLLEADLVSEAVNLENALAQSGQMGASRTSADLERKFEVLSRYEALAMQTIAKADILMGRKPGYELRTTPRLPIQMSQHARLEWKETVRDFFAKMPLTCSSCGVLKPTLRKDAFAKIFIRHRGKTKSAVKRASKKSKRKEDDDEEDLDELDENGENEALIGKEIYLHPIEVRGQLENLWKNHASLCSRIWGRQRGGMPNAKGYSSFFSQIVPVPPSRFRPPAMMNGMTFEHPQNVALNKVLRLDEDLRQVFKTQAEKDREEAEKKKKKKKKDKEKSKKKKVKESKKRNDSDESNSESDSSSQSESSSSSESSEDEAEEANKQLTELDAKSLKDEETLTTALNIWVDLQDAVNAFIDGTKSKEGARAPPGVRQGLEKKEGLFRQNMMGKRVNYAARSVISPDPYIGTDEVGLPVRFATKLSYPEPVTRFNAKELAQMVRNGPNVHPGALYVENEDGKLIDLSRQTERQRDNLAAQLEQFNSFALVEEQSVRASRFLPSESNGVFRREHNQQHAPLTLRKQKKVWRHARSGDFMLANRQPTLHKPSLMAHKVRVINNPAMQTIRLHYANCNSYNADFDGDEINLHLPQSELCRAEAYEIAYTNQQYCSTTDGSPLRGLIQDHVGMGVMLTKRNTFLTKEEYCQMVFVACASMNSRSAEIKLVPPAILFPRQLWTGKQVITTIIQHLVGSDDPTELLTMGPGKTKIPALAWVPKQPPPKSAREKRISDLIGESDGFLSETKVILRQGVLCTGVLDKAQFGASEYGLVHSIYELYGANAAGEILSSFGRLFTFCAQKWGHTCAIEDLLLNPDAERFRTKTIEESVVKGIKLSAEFAGIEDYEETKYSPEAVATALEHRVRVAGRKEDEAILDSAMQGVTSEVTTEIIDECLPKGLRKPFPKNCFSLMVYSGAKGSMVNQSQVSCALGQQALEGRRVPRSIAGKSLPCFSPFDPTPRAGGYVSDRFLTGVRPQEYYFHCMAGREGLIDTAVKTANSGYLQRCLIKHLENVSVAYDRTVRQTDGSVLQFQYGGDGLDALNTSYLNGSLDTLGFLYSNVPALVKRLRVGNGRGELDLSRDDGVLDMNKALELHNLIKKTIKKSAKLPKGHTALFAGCLALARRPKRQDGSSSMTEEALSLQLERARVVRTNRDSGTVDLIFEKDGALVEKVPVSNERTQNVFGLLPDPVMSSLSPDTHLGAVNECLQGKLDEYIAENPHGLLKDEDDDLTLQQLIWIKYLRSLAAPGENVGVIAGQSVGEPSTQMTLNTFHLAGHGAGNVTLGIPRLRELLMTASVNIKTPTMSLPLLPSVSKRDAEKLNSSLYCLRLSELLRLSTGGIRVVETMCRKSQNSHKLHKYTAAALMCRKEKGAGEWIREYSVELLFQPMEVISAEFGLTFEELIKKVAVNFCPEFAKAITTEMRRSGGKTLKRISAQDKEDDEENESKFDMNNGANDATKKKKNKSGDDSDDSDDDSDEDSEGENETLRLGRQKEVDGYEDDSDAESSSDDERPSQTKSEQQQKKKEGESSTKEDDEDVDEEIALLNGGGDSVMVRGRRVRFVHVPLACRSLSAWATTSSTEESKDGKLAAKMTIRLRFPASEKKLLMVGIAEAVAEKCVIQSVKGIEASFVVEKKEDKSLVIQTKGCNLATAWELADRVDVNRLDSNDIGAFLNTYGVEAARAAIVKEVKNVFGVYGIGVDERHLGLIADYMTHEGGYKAFNRTGINSATSPFVRMTFETSANFLLASALEGEVDALDSTSARLCVGQLLRSGTGAFDVMVPNALTPDVELSVDAPVHTDGREKKKKAKKEKKEKKEKKHKKSRD